MSRTRGLLLLSTPIRTFVSENLAVTTQREQTHIIPINFNVASKIEGVEYQTLKVFLKPGQTIRAESGSLRCMSEGIEMNTTTGGFSSALKRYVTGENVFVTDFSYNGTGTGMVTLASDFPSKILRLSLTDFGGSIICQKGAFLASTPSISIEIEVVKRFSIGLFGDEGFILQRLEGQGDVFVKACGHLSVIRLNSDQSIQVSSGCVVGFSPTVNYDFQMVGGIKNKLFGGEGLFITKLTGPGIVYCQGMPFNRFVEEIVTRIPAGGRILMPFGVGGVGGGGGSTDDNIPQSPQGVEDDNTNLLFKDNPETSSSSTTTTSTDTMTEKPLENENFEELQQDSFNKFDSNESFDRLNSDEFQQEQEPDNSFHDESQFGQSESDSFNLDENSSSTSFAEAAENSETATSIFASIGSFIVQIYNFFTNL